MQLIVVVLSSSLLIIGFLLQRYVIIINYQKPFAVEFPQQQIRTMNEQNNISINASRPAAVMLQGGMYIWKTHLDFTEDIAALRM